MKKHMNTKHADNKCPTGPLMLKVASKNPWVGDYMQKKDLEEGFNLVYVVTILIK